MPLPLPRRLALAMLASGTCWLAGCDLLGIESASAVAAKREAEGKAVGAGCRHAARSIEACFDSNKRADKAAVFAGWREMEDYMRENKIAAVPPPPADTSVAANGTGEDKAEDKPEPKAEKLAKPAGRKSGG